MGFWCLNYHTAGFQPVPPHATITRENLVYLTGID
jgi:hypothetical protein